MSKKQTVYLPVKVEDELPQSECFNINFHNQLHCGYVSENKLNGGYKSEDDNSTSNHLIYWLKPQELLVFTPEQLNEYTQGVIKQALETAAEKAIMKEHEEGDWDVCWVSNDMGDVYVLDKQSITNTLEQTYKKFEV